jgi:hypothetical protein
MLLIPYVNIYIYIYIFREKGEKVDYAQLRKRIQRDQESLVLEYKLVYVEKVFFLLVVPSFNHLSHSNQICKDLKCPSEYDRLFALYDRPSSSTALATFQKIQMEAFREKKIVTIWVKSILATSVRGNFLAKVTNY